MSRLRIAVGSLLLLLVVVAGCKPQATMTPERFQELVATPGDNVPLIPILTNGAPIWTNVEITMVMKYASGREVNQTMNGTAKTVAGKYVVHTMQADFLKEPVHSIFTYDEKSGQLKEYGLFNDTLTEATITFDSKAKTFSATASYATGFTETSTGSWSDTEETAHVVINQNGEFFMTRDETTRPVSSLQ